jgi:hypothetical protein
MFMAIRRASLIFCAPARRLGEVLVDTIGCEQPGSIRSAENPMSFWTVTTCSLGQVPPGLALDHLADAANG